LTGANLEVWKQLEAKAILRGSEYDSVIGQPLLKPLYDRIDKPLKNTIQIPAGAEADNDIWKPLTLPKDRILLPCNTVFKDEINLAITAFPKIMLPKETQQEPA